MIDLKNINEVLEIIKFYNDDNYDFNKLRRYINSMPYGKYFGINENNDPMSKYLAGLLTTYYNKMCERTKILSNIISNENLTEQYKKVLVCSNLPFRNIEKSSDKTFLEMTLDNRLFYNFTEEQFTFENVIRYFSEQLNSDPKIKEQEIKNISNYLNYYNLKIDLNNLDYKIFGYSAMPYKSITEINNNYEKAKEFKDKNAKYNGEERNTIIGRYGELIVYLKEKEKYKDNENVDVIWVSKDVGDGFGYDIMTIDHLTNETRLIEVKATTSTNINYPKELSMNESDELRVSLIKENETYCVDIVYLNDDEIIYNYEYDKDKKCFMVSSNIDNNEEEFIPNLKPNKIKISIPEKLKQTYNSNEMTKRYQKVLKK